VPALRSLYRPGDSRGVFQSCDTVVNLEELLANGVSLTLVRDSPSEYVEQHQGYPSLPLGPHAWTMMAD
jgi:hypothetical protein